MKKRLLSLLLAAVLVLSMLSAVSCSSCTGDEPPPQNDLPVTRVTVDVNPSIEFMVGENGKVVSVTALNDDGSILIAGEAFIGKTPEQAVELAVTLACNTGYLIEGDVEAGVNKVKLSVSGDSDYAKKLATDIENKAKSVLESKNIKGAVEKIEALKLDALKTMAADSSLYTAEELDAMTEEQLYKVLMAERIDTALLLTEELRDMYYSAKEHKISFAEREETAAIIEAMGGIYAIIHTSYKSALTLYGNAIDSLDTLRYNMLVSPDSAYQKALAALREAKSDLIAKKNIMISVSADTAKFEAALNVYLMSEETYNAALTAFQNAGSALNDALYSLILALQETEQTLANIEDMFSDDIKAELTAKAKQLEDKVNAEKDAFFTEFENAHKDDITAIENSLKERKLALINAIAEK